jgi:hypothetical protein
MRVYDTKLVAEAVAFFLKGEPRDFDAIDWVANHHNIILQEGKDLALFECQKPGIVAGHYYFQSRGRQAINVGRKFLNEVFDEGVQLIQGMTPLTNLGARWMSRQLGFTSHGVMYVQNTPYEFFTKHRSEHNRHE